MGIQLVAKRDALEAKGFVVEEIEETICDWNVASDYLEHCLEVYGEPPSKKVVRLVATSPEGEVVESTANRKDAIQFDNKEANMDLKDILDRWGVEYTRW